MRSRSVLWTIWVIALACPSREGIASSEQSYEVTQPIVTENGVWARTVTAVAMLGSVEPYFEIEATASPSRIQTPRGMENRNLANLAGIRVQHVHHGSTGLAGDTLMVTLDVGPTGRSGNSHGYSLDTLIAVTIECMKENASRAAGREWELRHLDVMVVGSPAHARYGSVFKISALPPRKQYTPRLRG